MTRKSSTQIIYSFLYKFNLKIKGGICENFESDFFESPSRLILKRSISLKGLDVSEMVDKPFINPSKFGIILKCIHHLKQDIIMYSRA